MGAPPLKRSHRWDPLPRLAAWAGFVWPPVFGCALFLLTVLQARFLRSLGWHPVWAAAHDWPSGLVLGPLGGWMTAVFLFCGGMVFLFAAGLGRALAFEPPGRWAARLVGLAGLSFLLLAAPADPTLRATPATLAGRLHDAAYVLLGLALFPAVLLTGWVFWRHGMRQRAVLSWLAAALAAPSFVLKGLFVYLFLASLLVWAELAAVWLVKEAK